MKNLTSKAGFTLLEVILSITILSTLSLLSTQAISRALKARTKIQAEVDDVSSLRDSMRMMRTDLNLAYHHRDFEQEINDLVTKNKNATTSTPGGAPRPAQPNPPAPQTPGLTPAPTRKTKRGDPATHFVGQDDKMSFVTMNNGRMTSTTVQADFIEVGYELKSCKNLVTQKDSKCLFRRVQTILDDDVTVGGSETVMLENVGEFKLRYIGEGKQDWANNWKSTKDSVDEVTKNKFPESVEITLSVEREIEGKKKKYDMNFVVPIHNPNNPDKSATGTNTATGNDGSPPSNPSGTVGP